MSVTLKAIHLGAEKECVGEGLSDSASIREDT